MTIRKLTTKMPKTATLKQILKKCLSIRRNSSSWLGVGDECLPEDFPRGHFAMYVGEGRSKHIVPISLRGHTPFQCLLQRAEEEYGFGYGIGITLPCEKAAFSSLLTSLVR